MTSCSNALFLVLNFTLITTSSIYMSSCVYPTLLMHGGSQPSTRSPFHVQNLGAVPGQRRWSVGGEPMTESSAISERQACAGKDVMMY
ncbi:hypothetical protein BGW80DRAFT_1323262, partial [Lactifluus volemus]